jgi:hypothetical protein
MLRAVFCFALALGLRAQAPVSFERDLKPILNRQCLACHQPSGPQSGLSLASVESFIKGGAKGAALVAGQPDQSLVMKYLVGEAKPSMPLGGKLLPAEQVDLFRRWIREGAKDDSVAAPALVSAAPKVPVYKQSPLITAVAFSPDGQWMAASGYREILLHEMSAGRPAKLSARLPGRAMRIHGLAFSADSKTLVATGGDPAQSGEVQVWDVAGRSLRSETKLSSDTFFGVALSPDGTRAAFAGADKSIRLFDVVAGKEIRKMDHHEEWAFATVFGIDGKRLVSVGRDRAAKLIDASSGAFIENVNLLRDSLTTIARHPRRDWVVIGGQDRTPYLYRMDRPRAMRIADDSTLIRQFAKQDGPILSVAFSPDGSKIAVGAELGPVRVYDAETGDLVASCSGHQGGIYSVQFVPDGSSVVAAGFDGQIRFFSLKGELQLAYVPVPIGAGQVATR